MQLARSTHGRTVYIGCSGGPTHSSLLTCASLHAVHFLQASLAQLQMAPGQDAVTDHTPFPSPANARPTDEDLAVLGRWVNPAYLSPKSWPQIQRKFEADGSIQLQVWPGHYAVVVTAQSAQGA